MTMTEIYKATFGKPITKHFAEHEFMCRCGCETIAYDLDLFNALESLRHLFCNILQDVITFHITSGYRCIGHNARVSLSKTGGYHPHGMAADFYAKHENGEFVAFKRLYRITDESKLFNGLGAYPNMKIVHVDIRHESEYNRFIQSTASHKLISLNG